MSFPALGSWKQFGARSRAVYKAGRWWIQEKKSGNALPEHLFTPPSPGRAPRARHPSQFIVLTKQKSAVVWGKTHPQKLFCHQLPPHLYFILAGSSTAQVFPRTCTLPALGLLQWLHLLGKNSPKLGQQMRCLEVEAIAKHLYLFISSLAPDLANNH